METHALELLVGALEQEMRGELFLLKRLRHKRLYGHWRKNWRILLKTIHQVLFIHYTSRNYSDNQYHEYILLLHGRFANDDTLTQVSGIPI